MPLYIEHWTARPSWHALTIEERIAYLDDRAPVRDILNEEGATLVGTALTERPGDGKKDSHYVAVWRMPEEGHQIQMLNETLERAGWREYFEEDSAK